MTKPIRHGKAQLEDPLAPIDMASVMWMPMRGCSETRLRGRLDQIRGSPGQELCQHMPADMRGDWRSAIGDRVSCDEGGKERVLDSGKVLMGGIAALSINGPSPVISLSISDFPPRPHLLKQISQSESPGPVRTLCLRMVFVDMDAITFYERPPPKAGLSGDKRLPASNRNVPTVGQQRESHQAFAPSNRPSWTLQEFDLIKILDMTTSSLNEPLNPFGKLGPKVKATGVDVGGQLLHFSLYELWLTTSQTWRTKPVLMTGAIAPAAGQAKTFHALKNCYSAPRRCKSHNEQVRVVHT